VLAPLDGERAGEREHSCFGARGGDDETGAAICCGVSGDDAEDVAGLFFLDPVLAEDLCAVEAAVEDDADDGVESVGGKFFGAGHEIAGGVVDDRVDFADFFFGGLRGGFYGGVIAYVAGGVGGGAACLLDFIAYGFEGLGAASDDEYVGAESGEVEGHGAAES